MFTVSRHRFTVQRCDACGHRFTDPVPAAGESELFYDGDAGYQPHQTRSASWASRLYFRLRDLRIRRRAAFMTRYAGRTGRCLEIGCGTGDLLVALRSLGWETQGLEPSSRAAAACRDRGLDVTEGETLENFDGPYDLIVLWHVIEHLPHPDRTLADVRGLLADDGLLVLAMPNIDALDAAHYKTDWLCYDIPRHLHHFSLASVSRLCERIGYRVEAVWRQAYEPWFSSVKSQRGPLPLRLLLGSAVGAAAIISGLLNTSTASSPALLLRKSD